MNKFGYLLASTALAGVMAMPGVAEAQSSKAVAVTDNAIQAASVTVLGVTEVLNATLHTANNKDLFIGVSIQCGLSTTTKITSVGDPVTKGDAKGKQTALAEAEVQLRLTVSGSHGGVHPNPDDGNVADTGDTASGWVTFCSRSQTLEGILGKALFCEDVGTGGGDTTSGPDGTFQIDECDIDDQEISLAISTLNANTFNFIVDDLSSGDHSITVEARINTNTSESTTGTTVTADATATALIGAGSLMIQEVRMVRGHDVTLD